MYIPISLANKTDLYTIVYKELETAKLYSMYIPVSFTNTTDYFARMSDT